jgi:hypothetical protein
MIGLQRTLRGGIAVAILATVVGGVAAPAAHADWYHDHGYRQQEWREHERRREEWRDRRYDNQYYYGNRRYYSPPVVYGPPPPPSGLNLLFNIR